MEETNDNLFKKIAMNSNKSKKEIIAFGKAISSPIRLQIIELLKDCNATLVEISSKLGITNSTALFHLDVLLDSGLVLSSVRPSIRGSALCYFLCKDSVLVSFDHAEAAKIERHELMMPIGLFIDAKFDDYLRIATDNERFNLPSSNCFSPLRKDARLIGTKGGYLLYRMPISAKRSLSFLKFSLELSSETFNSREDWKSDISFEIDGKQIGTFISQGDYGKTRGKYNPDWWSDRLSQYGVLVTILINERGVFINEEQTSFAKISDFDISKGYVDFKISCLKGTKNYGGFNLFGKGFGDYDQDILVEYGETN